MYNETNEYFNLRIYFAPYALHVYFDHLKNS